jgi:hypothetical protein
LAALLVAFTGVLFWLPIASLSATDNRIHIALKNYAHLPLFGVMALVLFAISVVLLRPRLLNRATHYWLSLGAAAALALGTELVQFFGPRDAALSDIALDLVGAAAALGVLATFDPRLTGTLMAQPRVKRAVRWAAAFVVVASFVPVPLWIEAYRQRDAQFPVLSGFRSYWERKFIHVKSSGLVFAGPGSRWDRPTSDCVARWTGWTGSNPSIALRAPYPDWRDYGMLCIDLYSVHDSPVRISLTINDKHHNRQYTDRFTRGYEILPGPNEIEIDLEEIRTSPDTREMDMSAITGFIIYSRKPGEMFTLYLCEARLERHGSTRQDSAGGRQKMRDPS